MFKFLDNLRKKPKSFRKFMAFGFAGLLTILIFTFWISGMYLEFSVRQSGEERIRPATPTQSLGGTIKRNWSQLSENLSSYWSDISSVFEDTEEELNILLEQSDIDEDEIEED